LEYKLVHMKGKAENKVVVRDDEIDFAAENCYRVIRTVEMWQWKETKHEKTDDRDRV